MNTEIFQKEKNDPLLLAVEAAVVLMTLIAIPMLCVKPLPTGIAPTVILIQKILPSILLVHLAISAIWDQRQGLTAPYYFTVGIVLFTISCVAQASMIEGPSFFLGFFVENKWMGRLLCVSQVLIAVFICFIFCILIAYLEEKCKKQMCGAGDIKCMVMFFFFPIRPDSVCKALLCGLVLFLLVCIIDWLKSGERKPQRGLAWMYLGSVPALLYFW